MPYLSRLASTYRTLFRKARVERDLDDELRGFLELREQELIEQGLSVAQARRTARLELGGAEQVKERVRDERRGGFIDTLRQDILFGARTLCRDPVLTVVTVATLAIAIGGTTAVVSTIDAALFRPVAYADADRLVVGQKTFSGAASGPVSRLDYKVPILDRFQDWGIWPASRPPATSEDTFYAMARWVTPGYFKTMGIPILAGRDISARDVADAPQVIVLSDKTARRLFPDHNPVGQAVRVWSTTGTFEVVGVVGDARLNHMFDGSPPAMYMSADQGGNTATRIVIRTTGDPAQLATPLREIVRARDRTVPLVRLMSMSAVVDQGLSMFRVVGLSLGIYSGIALLLAAIGLFGALAYHVSQQEGELSLRLAMGATPVGLLGRVLRRGLTLAGAGLLLGAIASVASARLLEQLPFTLQVQGPSNLALVLAGLSVVAIAASLIPAWRVTRINPVDALRKE